MSVETHQLNSQESSSLHPSEQTVLLLRLVGFKALRALVLVDGRFDLDGVVLHGRTETEASREG